MRVLHSHRRILSLSSFALASLLSLAACGAGSEPQAVGPEPTGPVTACDDAALKALYDKAKTETGPARWYYTSPPEQVDQIKAAFEKEFPEVKLDYVQLIGAGGVVSARFIQESTAGQPTADVMTGSVEEVPELRKRGLIGELTASELGIKAPALLPAPDAVHQLLVPGVVVRNTTLVDDGQVPKSWDEMVAHKWDRGFGAWQFPYAYVSLASVWGEEKAKEYVEKVAALKPFLYQSNFPLSADVGAGKIAIGLGKYHPTLPTIEAGAPVKISLLDPVPADTMYAYLNAHSPRPNRARLFLAWTLCGSGAKAVEDAIGAGNDLVEGTRTHELLKGHKIAEYPIKDAGTVSKLLAEFTPILQQGGTPVTPPSK